MAVDAVKKKKRKYTVPDQDEVIFTLRELSLVERIVRVEEEIKSINSNIKILIHQIDKRFEEMQKNIDNRFELMQRNMDKRFEEMQRSMDKRFDMMFKFMGLGFSIITLLIVVFKFLK